MKMMTSQRQERIDREDFPKTCLMFDEILKSIYIMIT